MINLMYCSNKNGFKGILLSLLSIIKYTKHELNVSILTMNLKEYSTNFEEIDDLQVEILEKIIKEENQNSKVKRFDCTKLFLRELNESPNIKSIYTPYCLLRLFADEICDLPEKVLYLDIDTMALNDIKRLYDIDVENYEFAGVRDYMGKIFKYPNYINSGVLLFNLKKIKETKLFYNCRNLIKSKKMPFPDQDALNKLVTDKLIVSPIYNRQRKPKSTTVIQHFCKGIKWFPIYRIYNVKPWDIEKVNSFYKTNRYDDVFDKYKKIMRI